MEENNKCLVICPYLDDTDVRQRLAYIVEEAVRLAKSLGLDVLDAESVRLSKTSPATLLGKGKVAEITEQVKDLGTYVTFVNYRLSPIQQRNLERALKCKVVDRTGVILEIFAARARTSEGKLQVTLASLEYQRSRLVRSWTHLERQRGGLGFIGGPGETQMEADKRILAQKIMRIKQELEEVKRTRKLHRKSRQDVPYPVVALVGYTNAGKSTLFNKLTKSNDVLVKDELFATLDPTMRMVTLPSKKKIILSDTVGFITDLPHELVIAFHATLEEVLEADLILHVRDISHPDNEEQKRAVIKVLNEIAEEGQLEQHLVEVQNKIDLLPATAQYEPEENNVAISAQSGKGCDLLLQTIDHMLARSLLSLKVTLPSLEGKALAWLYEHAAIMERVDKDSDILLQIAISPANLEKFNRYFTSEGCKCDLN
jgi:GTP-binding protein HflX